MKMKILAEVDFTNLAATDLKAALGSILDELKFRGDSPTDDAVRTFTQIIWKEQMGSVLAALVDRDKRENFNLKWPQVQPGLVQTLPKVNYAEASLMAIGNKIGAIKLYRERVRGCGLKDAKDVVDAFEKEIKGLSHTCVLETLNKLRATAEPL